jgi:RNA ligase (TIGR02306 family)
MRKLASIQTVTLTEPIPNADAIERVKILGWWVVAKKGEFRPGDRVVYCEIDSLMPERSEFEFLRTSCFKPAIVEGDVVIQRAGFRIKTIKLRGQVSQGICFPMSILPADGPTEIGDDVTESLGIIKY